MVLRVQKNGGKTTAIVHVREIGLKRGGGDTGGEAENPPKRCGPRWRVTLTACQSDGEQINKQIKR